MSACSGIGTRNRSNENITEHLVEVIPTISITVDIPALDFETVGAGLNSDVSKIRVVNTGTYDISETLEIGEDESGFYDCVLRLIGGSVDGSYKRIPANLKHFKSVEDVKASLEVPEWAGGEYEGTVLCSGRGDLDPLLFFVKRKN